MQQFGGLERAFPRIQTVHVQRFLHVFKNVTALHYFLSLILQQHCLCAADVWKHFLTDFVLCPFQSYLGTSPLRAVKNIQTGFKRKHTYLLGRKYSQCLLVSPKLCNFILHVLKRPYYAHIWVYILFLVTTRTGLHALMLKKLIIQPTAAALFFPGFLPV